MRKRARIDLDKELLERIAQEQKRIENYQNVKLSRLSILKRLTTPEYQKNPKKRRMGKKGISDSLLWGVFLLIVFISLAVGLLLMNVVNDAIQGSDMTADAKTLSSDFTNNYPSLLDYFFVMLFLGLMIASGLLSAYIDTNPAVMFVGLVLFILVLLIGGYFTNVMVDFAQDATMSTYTDQLPMTLFIINNYLLILLFFGGALAVIIWGKSRAAT